MIQDIEPFKFKNVYKEKEPVANDFIYMLRGNEILMKNQKVEVTHFHYTLILTR